MTALTYIPSTWYLGLGLVLFSIGVFGALIRRNAIIVLMCVELMLNAVNVVFVAFSAYYNDLSGQVFVFFVMLVAAAEAAVGLAIFTLVYHHKGSADLDQMTRLKG
jgi:NADH-quinone oxidoreductase subunit K